MIKDPPYLNSSLYSQQPQAPLHDPAVLQIYPRHSAHRSTLGQRATQAPLHDPAVLQIYPRHSLAHRADQAPPRTARRGPRNFILVGQAEPGLPKVLPHAAKRLDAAPAATRCSALTTGAGSAPRSCRPPDIPAALVCSPRRSGPTAHGAAGTPRFYFGRPGRARPPQGFAARGKTLGRRTRGDSLLCAYNRCRLRSTILPSSRYTRGTRLLTAQISS